MSPDQVHLIRKSFAELERHGRVAALIFYRRLFELAPGVRPMFKTDIESQAEKLTEMLAALIAMLERPATLDSELRLMGGRHAGYGVRTSHYAIVGQALLEMVREVLGERYTPETGEAWGELYRVVSEKMIEGASSYPGAPAPAGRPA